MEIYIEYTLYELEDETGCLYDTMCTVVTFPGQWNGVEVGFFEYLNSVKFYCTAIDWNMIYTRNQAEIIFKGYRKYEISNRLQISLQKYMKRHNAGSKISIEHKQKSVTISVSPPLFDSLSPNNKPGTSMLIGTETEIYDCLVKKRQIENMYVGLKFTIKINTLHT